MVKKPTESSSVGKVLEMISEQTVEYVDLRFTDPRGKWQHTAQHVSTMDDEAFRDGIMFDGSSIAGWKAINESDMILMPDPETAVMDPFSAKPSMILFCDIIEPSTGQGYARDPRSTAKKAEAYLKSTGVGDAVFIGTRGGILHLRQREATAPAATTASIRSTARKARRRRLKDYPEGNMGHRPSIKGGYFPVPPVDADSDLRAEMLSTMGEMGVIDRKASPRSRAEPARTRHEVRSADPIADHLQIYKYCIHNVANSYGKTATFMPKPIYGDNGSGMHVHQSIWKGGKPLFAGNGYADLSETCLYYIGGIIKHAKALNAFTNPATNSYKRLIPGFEAPVLLAYSARNRSASCRIPYATNPKAKRVEVRFPDAAANPYLAFSAMLMAGLDGIKNKIHPGDPMDKDLYDLPPEELKGIPTVCGSLREALGALTADHEFLLAGDVFSSDQIESYIELKWSEVYRFEHTPHPVEFEMYYSV
jgi:glutamine synthetase